MANAAFKYQSEIDVLINGFSINFDFSKLIKVADLIYHDGPLLSHYVSNKGENYLFYWVDVDNEYNRWVVIRTDIFSIQQYLEKKSTLHSIITQPNDGFVYTVDIDDKIHYHNIKLVPIANLPEEYTPTENSYYAFEIEDNIDLAAISQNKEKIKDILISFVEAESEKPITKNSLS